MNQLKAEDWEVRIKKVFEIGIDQATQNLSRCLIQVSNFRLKNRRLC